MGKRVQQSDMDFIIEKIWNFYNRCKSPKPSEAVPGIFTGQPQLKPNTSLLGCMANSTASHTCSTDQYSCMLAVRNPYNLYDHCTEFRTIVRPPLQLLPTWPSSCLEAHSPCLLAPSSSQLNLLYEFLSLSVSCLCRNTSVCVLSTN